MEFIGAIISVYAFVEFLRFITGNGGIVDWILDKLGW